MLLQLIFTEEGLWQTAIQVQVANNNSVLDLTQAASGIYFVTIIADNQKTIKRIIKK